MRTTGKNRISWVRKTSLCMVISYNYSITVCLRVSILSSVMNRVILPVQSDLIISIKHYSFEVLLSNQSRQRGKIEGCVACFLGHGWECSGELYGELFKSIANWWCLKV